MPPAKRPHDKSDDAEGVSTENVQTQPGPGQPDAPTPPPAPVPHLSDLPDDLPPTGVATMSAIFDTPAGDDEVEPIDRLIEQGAQFFPGYTVADIAGALHFPKELGVEGLTRNQAAEVLRRWGSSEVVL